MTRRSFDLITTAVLADRLEMGDEKNALNNRVLEWLATEAGIPVDETLLLCPLGVAGEMSGAIAIAKTIFPGLRWTIGTLREDPLLVHASVMPEGAGRTFDGEALDGANALLAALLRAFSARATIDLKARAA